MTVATTTKLVLEPAAQDFADATANPPWTASTPPSTDGRPIET